MFNFFKHFHLRHTHFWNKEHLFSLISSVSLFILALIIQRIADIYVGKIQGTPVDDIILNNLPAVDIDSLIIFCTLLLTFIIVILFSAKPKYLNFGLKAIALFIIVRSFFISLTHLGASPEQLQFDPATIGYWLYNVLYNTRGDYFFSGHTGIPVLMALIFWPEKKWRYFFLITSGVSGAFVLLAHIHYSIDVFAAPFMTFGIFTIARHLFKKDYQTANS
jgi:hypothetical protein